MEADLPAGARDRAAGLVRAEEAHTKPEHVPTRNDLVFGQMGGGPCEEGEHGQVMTRAPACAAKFEPRVGKERRDDASLDSKVVNPFPPASAGLTELYSFYSF